MSFSGSDWPDVAPDNEAERQEAVSMSGALAKRGDRELARITEQAASSYGVPMGSVSIISQYRQILLARCGAMPWESSRDASFCAVAIHRPGEPLVVPDALADRRFQSHPAVRSAPFLRFYAGMPIVSRSGYALGALCIADTRAHTEPVDLTKLMMLAHEAERLIG